MGLTVGSSLTFHSWCKINNSTGFKLPGRRDLKSPRPLSHLSAPCKTAKGLSSCVSTDQILKHCYCIKSWGLEQSGGQLAACISWVSACPTICSWMVCGSSRPFSFLFWPTSDCIALVHTFYWVFLSALSLTPVCTLAVAIYNFQSCLHEFLDPAQVFLSLFGA